MHKQTGKYNGLKFANLLIVSDAAPRKRSDGYDEVMVLCKCDCGNEKALSIRAIKSGNTRSCGCLQKCFVRTHGLSKNPLYKVWSDMTRRCSDINTRYYKDYGGRGIIVCAEWVNDPSAFVAWGTLNGYAKGLELDRRENNGNYEPSNCRFITPKANARNKRTNRLLTYKGETKPLSEWIEALGLNKELIKSRLKWGWNFAKAVETPKIINGKSVEGAAA